MLTAKNAEVQSLRAKVAAAVSSVQSAAHGPAGDRSVPEGGDLACGDGHVVHYGHVLDGSLAVHAAAIIATSPAQAPGSPFASSSSVGLQAQASQATLSELLLPQAATHLLKVCSVHLQLYPVGRAVQIPQQAHALHHSRRMAVVS